VIVATDAYADMCLRYQKIAFVGVRVWPPGTPPDPGWDFHFTHPDGVVVITGIAPQDGPRAQQVLTACKLVPSVEKSHYEIFQGLQTLTGDQLSRAWNQIAVGWPNKLQTDASPYSATFQLADWLSRTSTAFTPFELDELKQRILGIWTLNERFYLVAPLFDPTIVVPGYKPA